MSARTSANQQALYALCRQLQKLQERARTSGLFIEDRELLDCRHCGLQEDVLIDGQLVTCQVDAAEPCDSGLRFKGTDDGKFICPQCKAEIPGVFRN